MKKRRMFHPCIGYGYLKLSTRPVHRPFPLAIQLLKSSGLNKAVSSHPHLESWKNTNFGINLRAFKRLLACLFEFPEALFWFGFYAQIVVLASLIGVSWVIWRRDQDLGKNSLNLERRTLGQTAHVAIGGETPNNIRQPRKVLNVML